MVIIIFVLASGILKKIDSKKYCVFVALILIQLLINAIMSSSQITLLPSCNRNHCNLSVIVIRLCNDDVIAIITIIISVKSIPVSRKIGYPQI